MTIRPLLAALALAWMTMPALAQETVPPEELRALRYYLEQGDTRSANAEIVRLRGIYPDWTPPADLEALRNQAGQAAGPGEDANRIWRLIEIGNLSAARGRLDHFRAVYPDWTPPAEMVRLLETSEAQTRFDAAVRAGNAAEAVAAARAAPGILNCGRVNNAWQLAALQAGAGQKASALQTYLGVAGSCTDTSVLVATLEKANDVASTGELAALADTARRTAPAASRSIDTVEARLLAGRGAGPAPAAPKKASTPRRAAPAASTPAPVRAATVASLPPAAPRLADLPLRGDPRIGQVRSLKSSGAWGACLQSSTNPRSIEVLYERAWCAYNQDRALEALAGFRVTAAAGLDATVNRDARFGMALAFLDQQMTEEAARIAAVTPLTDQQRVEVEAIILDQRGVRAYQREQWRDAINYFDAMEDLTGTIRRDLAILRAYAYLNLGQRRIAREQFEVLHDQLATTETRRGLKASM